MAGVTGEAESKPRWSAAEGLIWTQFDDSLDWVVFSPASANIHLLTASAHRLWTLVATEHPSTTEELTTQLASDLELPLDEEFAAVTRDALAFLDEAGLVRPA